MEPRLTFGELKLGDMVIGFPIDGSRPSGSYLFEKTSNTVACEDGPNARRLNDGNFSHMPPGMAVVKVICFRS